jgi:hypothetical protein
MGRLTQKADPAKILYRINIVIENYGQVDPKSRFCQNTV